MDALTVAAMPEVTDTPTSRRNAALHTSLRQKLLVAEGVPLSLVLPKGARPLGIACDGLDNPGSIRLVASGMSDVPARQGTIE